MKTLIQDRIILFASVSVAIIIAPKQERTSGNTFMTACLAQGDQLLRRMFDSLCRYESSFLGTVWVCLGGRGGDTFTTSYSCIDRHSFSHPIVVQFDLLPYFIIKELSIPKIVNPEFFACFFLFNRKEGSGKD